jgi:hypothetical protein
MMVLASKSSGLLKRRDRSRNFRSALFERACNPARLPHSPTNCNARIRSMFPSTHQPMASLPFFVFVFFGVYLLHSSSSRLLQA